MQSRTFRSKETVIERLIRVKHSAVTTQQDCSCEAGLRPGQEAKPAGLGETGRSGKLGTDTAAYTAVVWHRQRQH